jgi:hypothetical protein
MAPGSQEASFLTVEEEAVPSTSVSKKSVSFPLRKDYQEKLTKDRKGHRENQVELGTEVSKEDKANLGTYWKVVMKKLEVYVMELSPFKFITGSDTFWHGSIPNPLSVGIPTSVSQTTPETSLCHNINII